MIVNNSTKGDDRPLRRALLSVSAMLIVIKLNLSPLKYDLVQWAAPIFSRYFHMKDSLTLSYQSLLDMHLPSKHNLPHQPTLPGPYTLLLNIAFTFLCKWTIHEPWCALGKNAFLALYIEACLSDISVRLSLSAIIRSTLLRNYVHDSSFLLSTVSNTPLYFPERCVPSNIRTRLSLLKPLIEAPKAKNAYKNL